VISGFQIVALPALSTPDSLNINFGLTLDDANRVDADESSVVGLADAKTIDGNGWNNVLLNSGFGVPTVFTTATQSGNHIDLVDATGTDAGIDLTSSGAFYSNFGNVSSPNQASTGDAGLLQSYLLLSDLESVTLSGLSTWAPNGYKVRALFDIGPTTRTYGISMHDGGAPQVFWTADTAATDADPDNDGIMTWLETTATTEGAAVADANHALFGPFTGDTLTVSGAGSAGRAALSGLQIIPNTEPLATIVSFTATPDSFTAGQTVTLAWEVADADSVSINQSIGTVAATGTLELTPSATTTWTLTATRGATQVTARASAKLGLGKIDVYLLGGQSNMQGTASSSKLPAELVSIPEIRLYAAGTGVPGSFANQWVTLRPANGATFGPEIGIGEKMRDLCPGQPIALLKHAASGHSLEINFKPGANASDTGNWGGSFTAMVNTYNSGLAALEAEGWDPVIKGMCWQQGEQDAKDGLNAAESNTSADDYGANLSHFVARIREQFAEHASPDGIRFVPGQVLPYAPPRGDVVTRFPGRDLVRQAVLDADEDSGAPLSIPNTRAVPTNSTDHPVHAQTGSGDEVHLNDVAQLALGRSMAYGMLDLDPQSYIDWSSPFGLVGGPDDDDDHDGLSNRMEYLFGGHPKDSGDTPSPRLGTDKQGESSVTTYSLIRNLEATDAVPVVSFSADLVDWVSNVPTFISSVKQEGGTARLTFRGPWLLDDPAHPRGFFRTALANP